jgi:hypothetical protein
LTFLVCGNCRNDWQNGNASMEYRWHHHRRMHRDAIMYAVFKEQLSSEMERCRAMGESPRERTSRRLSQGGGGIVSLLS